MYGFCEDGKVKIVSPYQSAKHPFNKVITANGRVVKDNYYYNYKKWVKTISGGVIHSYSTLEGAVKDMKNYCDGNVIFKAIIPKGTKYYVGHFCETPAYGSKKLIITDTIVGTDLLLSNKEEKKVSDYLSDNFKTEYPTE